MREKICYYCGTKYAHDLPACPLCGQTETEPEAIDEVPVEVKAEELEEPVKEEKTPPKKEKKEPKKSSSGAGNTVATILCIVLGVAVVAGILFILSTLNIISVGSKQQQPPDEQTLNLPVTQTPEQTGVIKCAGIAVTPESIQFTGVGQKKMLAVSVIPENTTEQVSFESANLSVALVNPSGEVTAVASGDTAITVVCGDFAKEIPVSCNFESAETQQPDSKPDETTQETTVGDELTISSEDFTLFNAGETTKLTVEGASGAITWTSSDTSVATVDGGKVTAVGPGTATITASADGKEVKAIVRCKFAADSSPVTASSDSTGRVLSSEDVTLKEAGESFTLTLLENDKKVSGVSWSTNDSSVATVDENGRVTATGSGTAKIRGTYAGETFTCIVRCNLS